MRFIFSLGIILLCHSFAEAAPKNSIKCPVIADRRDGTSTNSSQRFYCFKSAIDSKKASWPKWTSNWEWDGGEATSFYQSTNFDLKRKKFRLQYSHLGAEGFKLTIYSSTNGAANGYEAVNIVGQLSGSEPIELLTSNIFYFTVEASGPWFVKFE